MAANDVVAPPGDGPAAAAGGFRRSEMIRIVVQMLLFYWFTSSFFGPPKTTAPPLQEEPRSDTAESTTRITAAYPVPSTFAVRVVMTDGGLGVIPPVLLLPDAVEEWCVRDDNASAVLWLRDRWTLNLSPCINAEQQWWGDHLELVAPHLNLSAPCCPDPGSCDLTDCHANLTLHVTVVPRELQGLTSMPPFTAMNASLIARAKRPSIKRTHRLISLEESPLSDDSGDDGGEVKEQAAAAILSDTVPFFESNVTITFAADFDNGVQSLRVTGARGVSIGPIGLAVSHHSFWTRTRDRLQLNATSSADVTLRVSLDVVSITKLLMYKSIEGGFAQQRDAGLMSDSMIDETKDILLDNNPWYLGLCFFVSMCHMLFEFLAFKNDVQFWKNKKQGDGSLRGLSLRSVVINCYFQVIIFLYLLDADESVSMAVILPAGIGVLIEFWKLLKCVHTQRTSTGSFALQWNTARPGETDATAEHDRTAVRYMMYIGIPLLMAYTGYSAVYETHTGWYSFIIRTQVRAIYYAGFAIMCPQIYINYKLKSVAAMPWRTLTYKFFNTILDDLFAFVIDMPTMHRVACFRDDVIFVILLVQRYMYPTDATRVNEYGQGGQTPPQEIKEKPKME